MGRESTFLKDPLSELGKRENQLGLCCMKEGLARENTCDRARPRLPREIIDEVI